MFSDEEGNAVRSKAAQLVSGRAGKLSLSVTKGQALLRYTISRNPDGHLPPSGPQVLAS